MLISNFTRPDVALAIAFSAHPHLSPFVSVQTMPGYPPSPSPRRPNLIASLSYALTLGSKRPALLSRDRAAPPPRASHYRASRLFALDWQKELEFRRQLIFRVQPVAEVDPTNAAISMDLYAKRLNVVGPVRAAREV
jgi:hypothetical protein